jgi:hypothetical protein
MSQDMDIGVDLRSFGTIFPQLQANDKLDLSLAWTQFQYGAEGAERACSV